jgi:SAM-dependent methyltransferase
MGSAGTPIADAMNGAVDRVFARVYDRVLAGFERGGMAEQRRTLLASARGRTLEIGAGTGANLAALSAFGRPPADAPEHMRPLTSLLLVEPVAPMRRRLTERLAATRRERPHALPEDTRIVDATADTLPVADGSVDTVISTLVLCSVPDQANALAEIRRVLAPGGRLLLVEHVAGEGRLLRRQRLIDPVWRHIGRGCHLTRDTRQALDDAGFDTSAVDAWELPGGSRLAAAIAGTAVVRDR